MKISSEKKIDRNYSNHEWHKLVRYDWYLRVGIKNMLVFAFHGQVTINHVIIILN